MKRSELARTASLKRGSGPKRGRGFAASKAQRAKVAEMICAVSGDDRFTTVWPIDAAHLCARSHGGCDDPLCVIPLRRDIHRKFDEGEIDLLPSLRPYHDERRYLAEILHALDHYDGDLLGLFRRLTGDRQFGVRTEAA